MNELFSGMATLNKKLLRDLWRVKGQVLAIVLVIGAIYVASWTGIAIWSAKSDQARFRSRLTAPSSMG